MYCSECGKELAENIEFCPNCGKNLKINEVAISPVIDQTPVIVEKPKDNNHLANVLCTISLCLLIVVPILVFIILLIMSIINSNGDVSPIIPAFLLFIVYGGIPCIISVLGAYVLMIVARVKCPKSKFAKVLMWIYIGMIALCFISFLISIIACGASIVWCGNELSNSCNYG